MNTFTPINSIALGKLLKRYKLIPKEKREIIKVVQKKTLIWSSFNRISKKFKFKESSIK